MYYNIKIFLNIPSKKKNDFIAETLIPFCREVIQKDYYFSRNIEILPVINLYIKTDHNLFTYFYNEFMKIFESFVFSLSPDERKSNELYSKRKSDIRKINGLRKLEDKENFTVEFYEMEYIERYGEYTYPQEKELYTEFFFKIQRTFEDTFLYLRSKGGAFEIPLIVSIFQVVSQQLDKTGIGRGYLSFKSHLLGFLNYKNRDISKYQTMFEHNYEIREGVLKKICSIVENKDLLRESAISDPFFNLVDRWDKYMTELYDALLPIQRTSIRVTYKKAIQIKIAHHKFRGMSAFHNEVFSNKNKGFFKTDEFRAYRMLVNFIYLVLPNMGMNSRKRVEASYMLVETMERE